MKQDVKEYVIRKLNEMTSIPYCCKEAKDAAADWLKALGTDKEAEQTKKLLTELEEDLLTIDDLIAFAGSEAGLKVFGSEEAVKMEISHAQERQAAGAKYCDCPACSAVLAILDKKEELILLSNLDKIHTTELGVERIKRNLSPDTEDVVSWCKEKIASKEADITRKGKNWYIAVSDCVITVNAYSYTIITAHNREAT